MPPTTESSSEQVPKAEAEPTTPPKPSEWVTGLWPRSCFIISIKELNQENASSVALFPSRHEHYTLCKGEKCYDKPRPAGGGAVTVKKVNQQFCVSGHHVLLFHITTTRVERHVYVNHSPWPSMLHTGSTNTWSRQKALRIKANCKHAEGDSRFISNTVQGHSHSILVQRCLPRMKHHIAALGAKQIYLSTIF